MQKKKNFFPVFLLFLVLAFLLFVFSRLGILNGLTGLFETVTIPIQRLTFGALHSGTNDDPKELVNLKNENNKLIKQLVEQKTLIEENQALRAQFETSNPVPSTLLPAGIIGMQSGSIIIDKGKRDGVERGATVVYEDNLIGRVISASEHLSKVELVTEAETPFTAKNLNSSATGIIKNHDSSMILENIVQSEKLSIGDAVVTVGQAPDNGSGSPAGLIIGKIHSVNNKASNLFQSAEIKSLVNIERLKMVFVMTQ